MLEYFRIGLWTRVIYHHSILPPIYYHIFFLGSKILDWYCGIYFVLKQCNTKRHITDTVSALTHYLVIIICRNILDLILIICYITRSWQLQSIFMLSEFGISVSNCLITAPPPSMGQHCVLPQWDFNNTCCSSHFWPLSEIITLQRKNGAESKGNQNIP